MEPSVKPRPGKLRAVPDPSHAIYPTIDICQATHAHHSELWNLVYQANRSLLDKFRKDASILLKLRRKSSSWSNNFAASTLTIKSFSVAMATSGGVLRSMCPSSRGLSYIQYPSCHILSAVSVCGSCVYSGEIRTSSQMSHQASPVLLPREIKPSRRTWSQGVS